MRVRIGLTYGDSVVMEAWHIESTIGGNGDLIVVGMDRDGDAVYNRAYGAGHWVVFEWIEGPDPEARAWARDRARPPQADEPPPTGQML